MPGGSDEGAIGILVVEDDVLVRMVARDALLDAGFRVLEAGNADEALLMLETRSDLSVMFTDCNMPGCTDGLNLSRIVYQRWPDIGIIVSSGKLWLGPDELPDSVRFLRKPYTCARLLKEVDYLLEFSSNNMSSILKKSY